MNKWTTAALITLATLNGCVGVPLVPDTIEPDFENLTHYEMTISEHVVRFRLPGNQRNIGRAGFRSEVDLSDESLYLGRSTDRIGETNWEWQPKRNVNGSLQLTMKIERFPITVYGINSSMVDRFKSRLRETRNPSRYRFKGLHRYGTTAPAWLVWDHPDARAIGSLDAFFHILDSEHVLRMQFVAIDNSHGKPENQDWYEEAERLVDEVMASIRIEHPADYERMEYGVPDRGLVEPGTLKYFDSISTS